MGGYTTRGGGGGGGQVKFYPYKKGVRKRLAMLKGGGGAHDFEVQTVSTL